MIHRLSFILGLTFVVCAPAVVTAQGDLNEAYQKVTQAALEKISPSVVQIVTQGGTDIIRTGKRGQIFRKALGPTTGLIVSKDGYIISSAFNFINNPTTVLVEVPGRKDKYIAKKVATDTSKMLTLLKIDAKDLPVPEVVAKNELLVGQWTLALGRTLDKDQDNPPSVSLGIISALGRVWGKCVQTDANTSPVNYGGPLVDIQGRVQGIIIPASPRGTGDTAGFEWYDSGIGFAVPMEDVMAVLPRLKKGTDLKKGLLGVRMNTADLYGSKVVIGSVSPNTAAARAGLKAGDQIIELEGKQIVRMAQLLHILGTKYEGDTISLKYRRGGKVTAVKDLQLAGQLAIFANAYMGILPMRDDPKLGVEIRHIFKDSPAEKAGLKAGDRIVKYGMGKKKTSFRGKVSGREEFKTFLNGRDAGDTIDIEVVRKAGAKKETLKVVLTDFPGSAKGAKDAPPKELPELASRKKALEPLEQPGNKKGKKQVPKKDKIETGIVKRTTASGNQQYWVYVHEDYDPNISHAMIVWLHPPGKNNEKDLEVVANTWAEYCTAHNVLIVAPKTGANTGWTPSDANNVTEVIRDALGKYQIDKQRIVTHGLGNGGNMAVYVSFSARDLVRGVATTGAVPTGLKDNLRNRPLQFFVIAGDRDPIVKAIRETKQKLTSRRLPVIYREIEGLGRQYMDETTLAELVRWLDALDRM